MYNIAALSNATGNVMAIMPHPERTVNGDKIFLSMHDYINSGYKQKISFINYKFDNENVKIYAPENKGLEWVVNMIITDNEASSVESALNRIGVLSLIHI